jgi:hypothetical protein
MAQIRNDLFGYGPLGNRHEIIHTFSMSSDFLRKQGRPRGIPDLFSNPASLFPHPIMTGVLMCGAITLTPWREHDDRHAKDGHRGTGYVPKMRTNAIYQP